MELCAPLELEVNFVGKLKISMSFCSKILREIKGGWGVKNQGKVESGKKGENQEQRIRKGSEYLLIELFTCYPAGLFFSFRVTKIIHILEEHMKITENDE